MEMTHDHAGSRRQPHGGASTTLRTAFLLTVVILLVELVGGLISHSLALLSDAGHVLTDILALGLAWFAALRAGRPADARNTYGYHRTGILAALVNAATLILVVGAIVYEAIQRLQHPQSVTTWIMFVSAAVGIAINLFIALGLHAEGSENLNVRGALLHALGDVGASAGVIIGGIIIVLTGWQAADPLISLAIAVLVARSAWGLLGETVDILMEATPKDLNIAQLVRDVIKVPGVEDVHDLHVWSIAGGMKLLSAHVQVADNRNLAECDSLIDQIHCLVCEHYGIQHTTVQLERIGCSQRDLYCMLPESSHDHAHMHNHTADGVHAHH
jgi:cobalt-zinc-cadmium efflux system protein